MGWGWKQSQRTWLGAPVQEGSPAPTWGPHLQHHPLCSRSGAPRTLTQPASPTPVGTLAGRGPKAATPDSADPPTQGLPLAGGPAPAHWWQGGNLSPERGRQADCKGRAHSKKPSPSRGKLEEGLCSAHLPQPPWPAPIVPTYPPSFPAIPTLPPALGSIQLPEYSKPHLAGLTCPQTPSWP